MGLAFLRKPSDHGEAATRRRVLVTGAAGRIGSYFAHHAPDRYDLVLFVRESDEGIDALREYGEVVVGDLADLEGLKRAFEGVDTIVHLAGDPNPSAAWPSLLETNIIGTYNTFVAAKHAGCRRVLYASSIHAVSGYPADSQVKPHEPVNPGDIYGVSKCFGEAMARYMATQEGVSAIAIRICAFQPMATAEDPEKLPMMDSFVSERDLNSLLIRCIDVDDLQFAIVHGISNNRFKRLDLSETSELVGFYPQDDFTEINPATRDLHLAQTLLGHNLVEDKQDSGLREELRRGDA